MTTTSLITLLSITVFLTSCARQSSVNKEAVTLQKLAPEVVTPEETPKTEAKKASLKTYNGLASWYSIKTNHGRTTASGRLLSDDAYTAAHKTLPFGTKVRVTSLFNGKSEVLRITDRGPYIFYSRGITKVKVEVLEWGTWKYKKP